MTVKAHFDGRAIIPDEPLDMPLNQALILQIERVGPREPAEEPALAWLAANAVENDALPTDLADRHDHYLYGNPTKDRRRQWQPASRILPSGWRFRASEIGIIGARSHGTISRSGPRAAS